jgi:hypothetical protein
VADSGTAPDDEVVVLPAGGDGVTSTGMMTVVSFVEYSSFAEKEHGGDLGSDIFGSVQGASYWEINVYCII